MRSIKVAFINNVLVCGPSGFLGGGYCRSLIHDSSYSRFIDIPVYELNSLSIDSFRDLCDLHKTVNVIYAIGHSVVGINSSNYIDQDLASLSTVVQYIGQISQLLSIILLSSALANFGDLNYYPLSHCGDAVPELSSYIILKLEVESQFKSISHCCNLFILRLSNVFGCGDKLLSRLVPSIIYSASSNELIRIKSSPESTVNLISSTWLYSVITSIFISPDEYAYNNCSYYYCGSSDPITVGRICDIIMSVFPESNSLTEFGFSVPLSIPPSIHCLPILQPVNLVYQDLKSVALMPNFLN